MWYRFLTLNPAEYDWKDLVDRIKSEYHDQDDIQRASHNEILASHPKEVCDEVNITLMIKIIFSIDARTIGGDQEGVDEQ